MALTELSQNSLKSEAVNESKIQISNAGTNGQYLQKQSGSTGGLTWADATSTTINSNTNNYLITGTGTANTLQGEASLTFDGNNLSQAIDASGEGIKLTASGNHWMVIEGDANRNNTTGGIFGVSGKWNGTQVGLMEIQTGQDTTNKDDGQINFYTTPSGGSLTSRLVIDPDGNVGIGEASPETLLNIKGTDTAYSGDIAVGAIFQAEDSAGRKVQLVAPGSVGEAGVGTPTSHPLTLFTANTERIRIDTSGNVGIGTAAADQNLSVVAANSATPRIGITNPDNNENFNISTYHDSNGIYATIGVNAKLDAGGSNAVDDSSHRSALIFLDGRNHGSVEIHTNTAGSTPTNRFKVDANGYVTKPYNVSFRADNLGNTTGSYSHSAGDCIWYVEDWDVGGCYDNSNGRFTAPVDGKYFFTVSMIYADDTQHSIWFRKNGGTILQYHFASQSSSEWTGRQYSGIMNLSQNDYVTLYHGSAELHGGGYSQFQGWLIG